MERLKLLVDWVNGDPIPLTQMRQRLLTFLDRFAVANVRLQGNGHMWEAHDAAPTELRVLRGKLLRLLRTAYPAHGGEDYYLRIADRERTEKAPPWVKFGRVPLLEGEDVWLPLSCPSLRFGILPGKSDLCVEGRLQHLVPFLVLHLLTSGQVVVGRCKAPAPRQRDERCNRFFVWQGRGRHLQHCPTGGCRQRASSRRKAAEERRLLRGGSGGHRARRGRLAR